ncbi:MAG: FAD-binding oxidoreductase [Candidatus Binataceae bacterium]
MSQPDRNLFHALREIVGGDGIVSRASELKVYECDGWTIEKGMPDLLVLPRSTAEVSAILAELDRRGIAFVPRGAGTGLSGGCLPVNAPVMICTSRMNRIVEIDYYNRRAVVEAGAVNLHVTNAAVNTVSPGKQHHSMMRVRRRLWNSGLRACQWLFRRTSHNCGMARSPSGQCGLPSPTRC